MLNIINFEEIYLKFIFFFVMRNPYMWKKKTNELVGKLKKLKSPSWRVKT